MQDDGLLDGLTALDISDTSQLSFTYQGRVGVLLGNSSSLDYKLRLAAKILTDPAKGLSGSDRGTLDVSDQLEDGEIRGYFQPCEQPTPTPEPAPEPDPGIRKRGKCRGTPNRITPLPQPCAGAIVLVSACNAGTKTRTNRMNANRKEGSGCRTQNWKNCITPTAPTWIANLRHLTHDPAEA